MEFQQKFHDETYQPRYYHRHHRHIKGYQQTNFQMGHPLHPHFPLQAPQTNYQNYLNSIHYHQINYQDHNQQFTNLHLQNRPFSYSFFI